MDSLRFPLVALLLLGLLWALWLVNAIALSFTKLGLSPAVALLVLLASLFGGYINIPLCRRPIRRRASEDWILLLPWRLAPSAGSRWWGDLPGRYRFFYYEPPPVREQVIAINVGGAVIPLLLDLYLLQFAPLLPTIGATALVGAVCYALARPVWPAGIVLPAFIPPLAAVVAALILAPEASAPVAYLAGTLGTLIGADLLHLPELDRFDAQMLSIGGAGVHDGIFLTGVVAVLLA